MKAYPRLYSLCTLNLRHHQEFEYLFHPLRTDFIGESGSGKSMIADMLQLIFVGSSAFHAATQGLEGDRRPEGMILPGETLGYAFLNIQCDFKKYLAIGIQLENTSRSTRLFIIQKGFGVSEKGHLQPFEVPLTINDFQHFGLILPLDNLADKLIDRGYEIISPTTKNYYKLLYQNYILPVDLTYSSKTLETYAKIIQAFSRKKSLDPKNPRELQSFLFGNEKGQEIYKEYDKTVNELQQSEDQYRNNREKVNQIASKGRSLNSLRDQQKALEQAKRTYLTSRFVYWHFQYKDRTTKLQAASDAYLQSKINLEHWYTYCLTQHTVAQPTIESLNETVQQAQSNLHVFITPFQRMEIGNKWLLDLNCNAITLADKYKEQTDIAKKKLDLEHLLEVLEKESLLDLFLESDWHLGVEKGRKGTDCQISDIKKEIEQKKLLQTFTDISQSYSLANWADNYSDSLDRIQVAVLVGLRELPQLQPLFPLHPEVRYIPHPELFFENLPNPEYDGNGFWLNIGGIKYYFGFVDDLHRQIESPNRRKAFFNDWTKSLDKEIEDLKKRKEQIQKLVNVLEGSDKAKAGANVYLKRKELETFELYKGFASLTEDFTNYHTCLIDAVNVQNNYQIAKKLYAKAADELNLSTLNFSRFKDKLDEIGGILSRHQNTIITVNQWIEEHPDTFKNAVFASPLVSEDTIVNLESIRNTIQNSHSDLLTDIRWHQLREDWKTAAREHQQAKADYIDAYHSLPEGIISSYCPPEPSLMREAYREAELSYQSAFDAIVNLYILNDDYKLGSNYNFVELAHLLLPGLFEREDITEEGVLTRITQRLNEINETNRALNIRKLNQIKELLNLVEDARRTIWTDVGRMQSFFERKENEITGGYQAMLGIRESRNFPLDWIRMFKRELTNPEFAERFMDAVSLKEKMQKAFELCGGYSSQVPIQELLNPNSYVELSYSMKSATEVNNAGSTGQTYAAIALLCIARLSLIHEKQRKGIRFMPVDEAEGLGSNFFLLHRIATQYDYQIISFSPNLVGSFKESTQYIYMLAKDTDSPNPINFTPMGIFKRSDLIGLREDDSITDSNSTDENKEEHDNQPYIEKPDDEPLTDET